MTAGPSPAAVKGGAPVLAARDTFVSPVPEDDVLREDDVGPFERASAWPLPDSPAAAVAAADVPARPAGSGWGRGLFCCCLGGQQAQQQQQGVSPSGSLGLGMSLSARLSARFSGDQPRTSSDESGGVGSPVSRRRSSARISKRLSTRKLSRLGSNAYSDAMWFDATSQFSFSEREQAAALAEVDQLVRELGSFKAPWVPDPPLAFAVPNMQFVKIHDLSAFAAYWLRDDERTTPPPQPIDVMLKANFIVQKSHNSIPGVWMQEVGPTEFTMIVKPKFLPPGFPRYQEYFDKSNETEPSWTLRRDLKTGRSYGKIYLTVDGTLIFRVWTRPMLSNEVDVITEEYMRLEEGGQVLVARQCCLQVATGKRAVQYLVGRRLEAPPKGHV